MAPLPFVFTINDPENLFGAFPDLPAALPAVVQNLSDRFDGLGSLEVEVIPSDVILATGRATAVVGRGSVGGLVVVDTGAASEAFTGIDPNGPTPDIQIFLNPAGTGVAPERRVEALIATLEHETLHALGFSGYRNTSGPDFGQFSGPTRTVFDSLTSFGSGGDPSVVYFTGPNAEALYGGPVPLTSVGPSERLSGSNYYHVGNPSGPGDTLTGDLMYPLLSPDDLNQRPEPLDLAILADLGWLVRSTPAPAPAPTPTSIPAPKPQPIGTPSANSQPIGTPPRVTKIVNVGHSKRGVTSISIAFDQALVADSAVNPSLYGALGGVTKRMNPAFGKRLSIRGVSYDKDTQSVTITLTKPYKGAVRFAVRAGVVAVNGTSSGDSSWVVN